MNEWEEKDIDFPAFGTDKKRRASSCSNIANKLRSLNAISAANS